LIVSGKQGTYKTDCLNEAPVGSTRVFQYLTEDFNIVYNNTESIFAANNDNILMVFDINKNEPVFKLDLEETCCLSFSPDGKWLVWAKRFINQSVICETYLYDVKQAKVIRVFQSNFKKNNNTYTYFCCNGNK